MNLLVPVLSASGSIAIMATVHAFLSQAEHWGDDNSDMKRQVVARVKPCIITQISWGLSGNDLYLAENMSTLRRILSRCL